MSKKIKKLCVSFALAAIVGVSAAASACTVQSKHPNAKITVEFNGETYEIEYTLYRNMYPQTVQHFIELADSGFYNDTIIHDYRTSDWVGGAYGYDDNEDTGYTKVFGTSMPEYLENHCKEREYYEKVTAGIKDGSFSASVYTTTIFEGEKEIVSVDNALPTLIGEFSDNGHKIEDNKGLTASYGTLKMVYYKKDTKQPLFVKNSFDQILPRDYQYNCATSLFSIQVSNSTIYDASKYCVFGQLKDDDAKSVLEDLSDAISDYGAESSSTKFTASVATQVDKEDKFADEGGREMDQTFTMTSKPIVIKKIEITKY